MLSYLIPALYALGFTLLLVFLALHWFPKWGLLDRPHLYQLKRQPIPYPGGFLLYFIFLIGVFLFLDLNTKLISLLVGAGILTLVSFIDDRRGLSAWFRLLVQIMAAVIMVAGGVGIEGITNPLGGYLALNQWQWDFSFLGVEHSIMVLSALFTVIWLVLVINTMNWLDGIPGLVSGIGTIGGFILYFLSISDLVNQPDIATMALIVALSSFVFWCFDFYPPKILIGDSGSMFLGLILAALAIFSSGKVATTFLILGFAILDVLYVVIHRLIKKQAPWKGGEWDRYRKAVHLHHRLLQYGFSEKQVLLIIYLFSAIFGVVALFIGTKGKLWAIVMLVITSFLLALFLQKRKSKNN